jgi:DNA-binding PucR family transcriptional regulator
VTALNVHRTSLYYRLGRFTELTGLDLADGGQRLAVHLGLKLLRLTTPVEGGAGTLPTRER